MPQFSIAGGERPIGATEATTLATKVQRTTDLLKESKHLIFFLERLFARPEMQSPTKEQRAYLHAFLDELLETLADVKAAKQELTLFQVLLRYNFNHEEVYKFCKAGMDYFILIIREKKRSFLRTC